jgi:hypothetical protein
MNNETFRNSVKYLEYDDNGNLKIAIGVIHSKNRIKELDRYIKEGKQF